VAPVVPLHELPAESSTEFDVLPDDTEIVMENGRRLRYQWIVEPDTGVRERVLLPPGKTRWSRAWWDVKPEDYDGAVAV
jgi:hypothetical protein